MKRTSHLDELCLPTIQELALKFHTDGEIGIALKARLNVDFTAGQVREIRGKYRIKSGAILKLWAMRERVDKLRQTIRKRMEAGQSDQEISRDLKLNVYHVKAIRRQYDIPYMHDPKHENVDRDELQSADDQFTRLMNACEGSFRSDVKTKCVGKVGRADPILPLTQSSIASCG